MEVFVLHLHLNERQHKKLLNHETFQLKHSQLTGKTGFKTELHVTRKVMEEVNRAIKNGKGYRFAAHKIQGGKLNISKLAKKVGHTLHNIVKSKPVKAIGHALLNIGTAYGEQNGYIDKHQADVLNDVGHNAIDSKITRVKNIGKNELSNYTAQQLADYGAEHDIDTSELNRALQENIAGMGIKFTKTDKQIGNLIKKVAVKRGNDIANGTNQLIKKINGGRLTKGSKAAKEHMAIIRSMKSGGSLRSDMKKFGRTHVGKALKNVGKNVLKGVADTSLLAAGTAATGNPLGGVVLSAAASPYVNKQIDGLGVRGRRRSVNGGAVNNYINQDIGAGSYTLINRSHTPRIKGGSFLTY